jgi:hypothetical protein
LPRPAVQMDASVCAPVRKAKPTDPRFGVMLPARRAPPKKAKPVKKSAAKPKAASAKTGKTPTPAQGRPMRKPAAKIAPVATLPQHGLSTQWPDPAPTHKPRPSESRKRRPAAIDPEKYPNLANYEALDRAVHMQRAIAMCLTPEEARRHADEDLGAKKPRKSRAS